MSSDFLILYIKLLKLKSAMCTHLHTYTPRCKPLCCYVESTEIITEICEPIKTSYIGNSGKIEREEGEVVKLGVWLITVWGINKITKVLPTVICSASLARECSATFRIKAFVNFYGLLNSRL